MNPYLPKGKINDNLKLKDISLRGNNFHITLTFWRLSALYRFIQLKYSFSRDHKINVFLVFQINVSNHVSRGDLNRARRVTFILQVSLVTVFEILCRIRHLDPQVLNIAMVDMFHSKSARSTQFIFALYFKRHILSLVSATPYVRK